MRILGLSDTHRCSVPNAVEDALVQVISSFIGELIVLNGDIIDFWHSKNITDILRANKKFFKALSDHPAKKVWVEGNHDDDIHLFSSISNMVIVPEFVIEDAGKRIVFVHGDKFDMKVVKYYTLAKYLQRANGLVDRWFGTNVEQKFKASLDKFLAKGQLNMSDDFAIDALLRHYKDNDIVCVGHYHRPELRTVMVEGKWVTYANSGDWVSHRSYIVIDNGEVQVVV